MPTVFGTEFSSLLHNEKVWSELYLQDKDITNYIDLPSTLRIGLIVSVMISVIILLKIPMTFHTLIVNRAEPMPEPFHSLHITPHHSVLRVGSVTKAVCSISAPFQAKEDGPKHTFLSFHYNTCNVDRVTRMILKIHQLNTSLQCLGRGHPEISVKSAEQSTRDTLWRWRRCFAVSRHIHIFISSGGSASFLVVFCDVSQP